MYAWFASLLLIFLTMWDAGFVLSSWLLFLFVLVGGLLIIWKELR